MLYLYEILFSLQQVLSTSNTQDLLEWCNAKNYSCYLTNYNEAALESMGIYDPILAFLINSDGLIQIGDDIAKLDMPNKTVKILPASEFVNLASFNTSNVKVFDSEDDVISILDGTVTETEGRAKYCSDDKQGYYYWSTTCGQVGRKIVYQKAGFYFSLQAKIKKMDNSPSAVDIYLASYSITDPYHVYFRNNKRCKTWEGSDGGSGREYNLRPYADSRRLTSYRWCINFNCTDHTGNYVFPTSTLMIACSLNNGC